MCECAQCTRPTTKEKKKAAQSHDMNAANLLFPLATVVGVSLSCAYINNVRYVQNLKQCGCERSERVFLFGLNGSNNIRTHMCSGKNSWLSMWACEPAFNVFVCLIKCVRLLLLGTSLRSSIYPFFCSTYDEYVSAWVNTFFPSLRDACVDGWMFFFFFLQRLTLDSAYLLYIHRHIFLRWLAAERSFFFTRSHLCSPI